MKKNAFITTSKKEYKKPIISIEELEKHDVLTASKEGENNVVEANDISSGGDLLSFIFNGGS